MKKNNLHKLFISYNDWVVMKGTEQWEYDPDERFDCPFCDEDGYIIYGDYDDPDLIAEKCLECDGDGYLPFREINPMEWTRIWWRSDYERAIRGTLWNLYDWQGWPCKYVDDKEIEKIVDKLK